jgi:hypothetical protein
MNSLSRDISTNADSSLPLLSRADQGQPTPKMPVAPGNGKAAAANPAAKAASNARARRLSYVTNDVSTNPFLTCALTGVDDTGGGAVYTFVQHCVRRATVSLLS